MRDKESKKKLHESKIGKIIYGFLLFMPLFAIGVTCGYAMFNKNAYKSKENTGYTQVYITNSSQFVQNNIYYFNTLNDNATTTSTNMGGYTQKINFNILSVNGNDTSIDLSDVHSMGIYKRSNETYLSYQFFDSTNTSVGITNSLNHVSFEFEFLSSGINDYFLSLDIIYKIKEVDSLDNIFYYSVDKVTQSNLFNWVTTSNIYTGMSNFTTAMSVTNTFIPMLLTYWLIISVIYFLYDMILALLTVLHRKIHNLQDSI